MTDTYHPWGSLRWIIPRLSADLTWDYLGVVSSEDRSIVAADELLELEIKLKRTVFWRIVDPEESPFAKDWEKLINDNIAKLAQRGVNADSNAYPLMESDIYLPDLVGKFIENATGNLILDISSMPKRWFFALIKMLLNERKINNLLVLYSLPASHERMMGEDPMPWRFLPSFAEVDGDGGFDTLFVSAGYRPMLLPESIRVSENSKVKILLPFPSALSGYSRIWSFVQSLEKAHKISSIIRVPAFDVSYVFNNVCKIIKTDYQARASSARIMFAPFGPKPISLAFSLIATLGNYAVGYTQPSYYNPYYSKGVSRDLSGHPMIYSYLIKKEGCCIYDLKYDRESQNRD